MESNQLLKKEKNKKEKVISFVKKHKNELILIGVSILIGSDFLYNNNKKNKKLSEYEENIDYLKKQLIKRNQEIKILESKLENQNKNYKRSISEGLRLGGRVCAQQMANERWNGNTLN